MTDGPLRVVVFNDSPTMRATIRGCLASASDIEIIAERPDATDAGAVVHQERPDVVVMDVVMPGVDGFEGTRAIMAAHPTPIVMVSSVVDPRDQDIIFAALEAGALHVAEVPPPPGSPQWDLKCASFQGLVRTIAGARVPRPPVMTDAYPLPATGRGPAPGDALAAIGVVSSAGGPQALLSLLGLLPPGALPPILLVQHLAPGFTDSFARWIESASGHAAAIAEHGAPAATGTIYVAPEDHHLWLDKESRLALNADAPVNGFRPSGDLLLDRLGAALGPRAAGVVLSGMGRDGARGARALKDRGGRIVVEAHPAIDSMPRAAGATGAVESRLSIPELARWVRERSGLT